MLRCCEAISIVIGGAVHAEESRKTALLEKVAPACLHIHVGAVFGRPFNAGTLLGAQSRARSHNVTEDDLHSVEDKVIKITVT